MDEIEIMHRFQKNMVNKMEESEPEESEQKYENIIQRIKKDQIISQECIDEIENMLTELLYETTGLRAVQEPKVDRDKPEGAFQEIQTSTYLLFERLKVIHKLICKIRSAF